MFDASMALRCSRKVRDVACMPRLSRIAVNPVMAPPFGTIVSAVWSISCKTDANCIEDRIPMMTKARSRRATAAPRALPPALRRIYTTLGRQSLPDALGAIAEVRDSLDVRSARRQAMLLRLRLLRAALEDVLQPAAPAAPPPDPEPITPPPPPPEPEPDPIPEPIPEPEPEPEPEI